MKGIHLFTSLILILILNETSAYANLIEEKPRIIVLTGIENEDTAEASFKAPSMGIPQEMHFILSVTDKSKPALTSYLRVVVKVNPKGR